MTMREAVLAVALLVVAPLFEEVTALGVLSSACMSDADCGPGLYCFSCEGAASVCTADQAFPVSSFAQKYHRNLQATLCSEACTLKKRRTLCLLTNMHGSPRTMHLPSKVKHRFWEPAIISPKNQEDTVTSQLNRGVRGLMLDIYELRGDLWLCHSTAECYDFTAFRPLNDTLVEIESFLASNPNEVITIFIEDYVTTPNALSSHFRATGLTNYMFPLANMPKDGRDWPTVASMIARNQRFVVFTSDRKEEATEGIAYQWNYVVENQYGTVAETCGNRAESTVLTDTTKALILENYFPNDPNVTEACVINSDYLAQAVTVCYRAAGHRWSNFLAVDFYKRSTAGGVFSTIDKLNGQHHCGCNDIRLCEGSPGPGICNAVPNQPAVLSPAVPSPSPSVLSPAVLSPAGSQAGPAAKESSSTYITTSKLILSLPFLISFFLLP